MRKAITFILALMYVFSLAGCHSRPEPAETNSPEPSPLTGTALWEANTLKRYNMEYSSFPEYWSMMCDGYFGENVEKILSIISFEEKEAEIKTKRAEFDKKYGADWKYELVSANETELSEKFCTDFAAELEELYNNTLIFTNEAAAWSDEDWGRFAESLSCTTEQAKTLSEAYSEIGAACHEAKVTKALCIEMKLAFSSGGVSAGGDRTETVNVYEVNGVFVSEALIDVTAMLINLIYT